MIRNYPAKSVDGLPIIVSIATSQGGLMPEIGTRILTKVRLYLEELRKNGITISKAYIFGSYMQGKADRWSDIDIAIILPQIGEDRFEERVRLTQMAISVDDRLEPFPFNPETFNDQDPLVKKIKKEGLDVNLCLS